MTTELMLYALYDPKEETYYSHRLDDWFNHLRDENSLHGSAAFLRRVREVLNKPHLEIHTYVCKKLEKVG